MKRIGAGACLCFALTMLSLASPMLAQQGAVAVPGNPYMPFWVVPWPYPLPNMPQPQVIPQPAPHFFPNSFPNSLRFPTPPFPTPFWFWAVPQPGGGQPAQPAQAIAPAVPASPKPNEAPAMAPSPSVLPHVAPPPAPVTQQPAATAATKVEVPAVLTPAPVAEVKTPAPALVDKPSTSPEVAAESTAPVIAPPPVVKPAATVTKRPVAKKPARKMRKLCWTDGKLDVCP